MEEEMRKREKLEEDRKLREEEMKKQVEEIDRKALQEAEM